MRDMRDVGFRTLPMSSKQHTPATALDFGARMLETLAHRLFGLQNYINSSKAIKLRQKQDNFFRTAQDHNRDEKVRGFMPLSPPRDT